MNLIFGVDWKLGSVIMIAVVVYMYFAKNVYKKPTVLRICMTISYIFALIMTISGLSTQIPKIIALFAQLLICYFLLPMPSSFYPC